MAAVSPAQASDDEGEEGRALTQLEESVAEGGDPVLPFPIF